MLNHVSTVAIDGPAGSGKSTVGAALAARLGFLYFDTGVMYRAVALAALRSGINPADEIAISRMAEALRIDVLPATRDDGRQYTVRLDGDDVTWALRNKDVEAHVSTVASYPAVREAMVRQQRDVAHQGNIVMVGRDIGTVVLPNADVKIYLTASAEERAVRRHSELQARGITTSYADVLAGVRQRDDIDSNRATSPLRPAEDAVIFDSTGLSVDEAVEGVFRLVASVTDAH
jgi:CMP/dCMP kinase